MLQILKDRLRPLFLEYPHHKQQRMGKRGNICIVILLLYIVVGAILLRSNAPDESAHTAGRRQILQDSEKAETVYKGQSNSVNQRKGGIQSPNFGKQFKAHHGPMADFPNMDVLHKYMPHPKGDFKVVKYDDEDNEIIVNPEYLSAGDLTRALSHFQYTDMMTLVEEVTNLLKKEDITFVMAGNTLAGSYVFHDLIPWYDLVELMIDFKDLEKVFSLFKREKVRETYSATSYDDPLDWFSMKMLKHQAAVWKDPDLVEQYKQRSAFKFRVSKRGSPFNNHVSGQWRWPFIHFSFFKVTDRTEGEPLRVHEVERRRKEKKYLLHSDFFPLHMRPFSYLWLPSPRDPRKVLSELYDNRDFLCKSRHIDNIRQEKLTPFVSNCSNLEKAYPHVFRQNVNGGVKESMIVSDKTVHTVFIREPHVEFKIGPHKYSIR